MTKTPNITLPSGQLHFGPPPAKRHNPVALCQIAINYVTIENDKYVEVSKLSIHELHPTKGWRKQRGSGKRATKAINWRIGPPPRYGEKPIVGVRYHVLPNPKRLKNRRAA